MVRGDSVEAAHSANLQCSSSVLANTEPGALTEAPIGSSAWGAEADEERRQLRNQVALACVSLLLSSFNPLPALPLPLPYPSWCLLMHAALLLPSHPPGDQEPVICGSPPRGCTHLYRTSSRDLHLDTLHWMDYGLPLIQPQDAGVCCCLLQLHHPVETARERQDNTGCAYQGAAWRNLDRCGTWGRCLPKPLVRRFRW